MINVKVKNIHQFLKTVDSCKDEVYIVYPSGGTENIRENPIRQAELVDEWRENGECLCLVLDIPNRRDSTKLSVFSVKN